MNSLPWFQFASFLDTTGAIKYVHSLLSDSARKKLCESEQCATSNNFNIGSLDKTAPKIPSQGRLPGSLIQSNQNDFQDSRFDMIPTVLCACGECNTNTLSEEILEKLSVLPENTQKGLRCTTESSVMQVIEVLMFLLSNNHNIYQWEYRKEMESTILQMVRARNGLQYKHLLSHSGPTSEALSEKAFRIALRARDVEACRILLDCGIDPNKQGFIDDWKTFTPLQYASSRGDVTIAGMLIHAGADVNGTLANATEIANPEMINLLLAGGAQAGTADGASALRSAVMNGDIHSAQSLISAGADVKSTDQDGASTALHLVHRNPEMVELLVKAGADVNAVDEFGMTVLEHVVQYECISTIESLLDAGLEIFGSAVYFAVDRNDIDILRLLLNAGANVDACFEDSRRTALTRAVENKNVRIVRFLLASGANVNGCTMEHECLDSFDLPVLRIGKYGYDGNPNAWDEDDRRNYTPLQAASFHQDIEIARILIEAGANVNMEFAAGPLDEIGIVQDPDDIIEEGEEPIFHGTAMQIAAHRGNMELIWLLCDAGASINAPPYRLGGRTALQAAIENGDRRVIDFILAVGADVNAAAAENGGTTVLAAAIMRQDPSLLSLILEAGTSLENTSAGNSGVTALAAAAANRDVRLVRNLLLAGVDPVDSLALEAAVANNDTELIQILMAAQANLNDHWKRDYGYLALGRATRDQRHELVGLLLASNIDPNLHMSDVAGSMRYEPGTHRWICDVESHNGWPWFVALSKENLQIVRLFLEAGADPNQVFVKGRNRKNGLLMATMQENLPLIQLLLEKGAEVNVDLYTGNSGRTTALGRASRGENTDMIHLLLKAGANPNSPAKGRFGRTALQEAAVMRRENVVDILLQAGADANAPPSPDRGVTALQAAAIGGYLRLARVLIEAGANVNAAAAEEEGRTALEGAAEHGRIDMLQYLLDNGASIDGPGRAQYESAIKFAEANGHLSAGNLLRSHHRRVYGS